LTDELDLSVHDSMGAVGNNEEVRAGSRVLRLVGNPVNTRVLRAHAEQPRQVAKLHTEIGWAAQTTLRASVAGLREVGALERETNGDSVYASRNRITPAGEELLLVADVMEKWLAQAPEGPLEPDSEAAKGAIKALAGGWGSTVMRALAAQPYSLAELDSLIPEVAYPSLERRLAKMRATRQVTPAPGPGRGTPYAVTDWTRRAIAPLCVAGRCERRHMAEDTVPISDVEVEAAFMLALPLAPLPPTLHGNCMLAVHTGAAKQSRNPSDRLSGVIVEVQRGKIVCCAAQVDERPRTWALGTPENWLEAVIEGELGSLRFGGAKPRLPAALVHGLHLALFGE
jgi:DNA-binding HxlR family transcriptional regulator